MKDFIDFIFEFLTTYLAAVLAILTVLVILGLLP